MKSAIVAKAKKFSLLRKDKAMAIKILIDSASDLIKKEADQLGVYFMPMEIRFGNEEYLDGVDLFPEQFYEKLVESDALPQTSQINPFRWEEEFNRLTADGSQLIVITISSKLSGTYASACTAAEKFQGKVFVLDSMSATIGERLILNYALDLVKKDLSAQEIMEKLEQKKKRLRIMAMLGTLEYLRKGGRISATAAFAGTLLSIKPVVAVIDGEVKLIGKAMGSKKGNNLLNSFVKNDPPLFLNKIQSCLVNSTSMKTIILIFKMLFAPLVARSSLLLPSLIIPMKTQ